MGDDECRLTDETQNAQATAKMSTLVKPVISHKVGKCLSIKIEVLLHKM